MYGLSKYVCCRLCSLLRRLSGRRAGLAQRRRCRYISSDFLYLRMMQEVLQGRGGSLNAPFPELTDSRSVLAVPGILALDVGTDRRADLRG